MDAFGRSTHFANTISIKYSSTNPMKTSLLNLYFGVHTNKWAIKIIDLGLKRKNSKTWMMIVIHNLEDHVVESVFVQFSSVTQSCLTLCNPMNRSTPGLPFYHQSLPKPMSIESVMPSNHLILCRPLLLLPSIFPSIRVFSNESVLRIR